MNKELIEALDLLEKEKNISKATLLEAIENSLLTACKNHFGKADNVKVYINPETGDFSVYAESIAKLCNVSELERTYHIRHNDDRMLSSILKNPHS